MATHLDSFTAKMDALRNKGFSDEEINALLSAPVSPVQPQIQAEPQQKMDGLDTVDASNVAQFLKSMPSPIPVNETMTDSDRTYAKEWNKNIDALSFFVGWKADALSWLSVLFLAWPIVLIGTSGLRNSIVTPSFAMVWFLICITVFLIVGIYIKEKYILPRMKFFLKKRIA